MTSLHFLIAGRDAPWRQAVTDALRAAGFQVLLATDGPMAAGSLAALPGEDAPVFDGVVLDLGMPGIDLGRLRDALAPESASPPDSLDAAERRQIVLALAYTHGNKRQAAHLLGVARSTLLNKVRRYGLT